MVDYKYKKDCPKCKGFGVYYVTDSDYEPLIQCSCDTFTDEEWKLEKKNLKSNFYLGDK